MNEKDLIRNFPSKRINPEDGIAITAEVWNLAHEYHRQRQQLYSSLSQGPGIVAGFEVEATDSPSSTVCISPGIAMDPQGQIIVLNDADIRRFDFESRDGPLHLVLSYHLGRPRYDKGNASEDDPKYIHDEYIIEAKGPSAYDPTQVVELARVRRLGDEAPITNAKDIERPTPNEIDLRYRKQVGKPALPTVTVGVSYMGSQTLERHGNGIHQLMRELRNLGLYQAWADTGISLTDHLENYALIYLVGQEDFKLTQEEIQAVYNYRKQGGIILIESCKQGTGETPPPAQASFDEMLTSMGIKLEVVKRPHELLNEPFLFAGAPAGFEEQDKGQLNIGEGVLLSTYDYGCLWQGDRRSHPARREEIRTAVEWGANLVTYALKHHKKDKFDKT